ncbi:MAG TPA: hypothetical protein VGL61_20140 [Kofleriaceae bacterium]|jgi:hypothetical protein
MGKPGKPDDPHDATQPLSESQVVAVTSNPPISPPIAPNDQSIAWKGTVVSADEFAPRKPRPTRAKWIVIGVLGAAAVGGVAVELVPRHAGEPASVAPVGSSNTAGSAAAIMIDAAAVPAVIPADAVEPPQDAALPVDAAVPAAVVPVKHPKKKKPRPRGH